MGDLENFLHDEENLMPYLLKIALAHYQFETIHPFLDGNGRIGRLMITVYLVEQGLLKRPVLYLSDFFERHRDVYYDTLTDVRQSGNLTRWFTFFLNGIIETARNGVLAFDGMLKLEKDLAKAISEKKTRSSNLRQLGDRLFRQPVIDGEFVVNELGVSKATAYRLITQLEEIGILREYTGAKRNRIYMFEPYLKLFA
jgi:Fic family protein